MDVSLVALKVLREVADRGSFSAAAQSLGYTQSAVSRQVAALEHGVGARVFDRRPDGVRLTAQGRVLLRHASVVLDELDAADRELKGQAHPATSVRLGAFASAGGWLIPRALAAVRRTDPGIDVSTRELGSPALVRALRAGSLDLALIALSPPFRPPDEQTPVLALEIVSETELLLALPERHPLAENETVRVEDLEAQRWIASRGSTDETLLGVWPGLAGKPRIAHVARDWLTKLQLVAAGCGITTIPSSLLPAAPPQVRVVSVVGGSHELRRLVLARQPGEASSPLRTVMRAIHSAAGAGPN